jgi:hypothetical protein
MLTLNARYGRAFHDVLDTLNALNCPLNCPLSCNLSARNGPFLLERPQNVHARRCSGREHLTFDASLEHTDQPLDATARVDVCAPLRASREIEASAVGNPFAGDGQTIGRAATLISIRVFGRLGV